MSGYYLSPTQLPRDEAEEYCQQRCNSHLASFHNMADYTKAIETITNNTFIQHLDTTDIWIGLGFDHILNLWYWTDESLVNYGNNTGNFPWKYPEGTGLLSDRYCTVLSSISNYEWQSINCNDHNIFLCNSCNFVVNKYVAMSSTNNNYIGSNMECNNNFETTLASIHNERDYFEAKLLCYLATNKEDKSCWIGLDDIENKGEYKWIDNTTFDFNGNISMEHNINNECIGMNSINFHHSNCDIIQSFICNLPSTLCNKNQWNVINGDWRFDDRYCDIYNYDNGHDRDDVLLMDIKSNNWKYIVIDYMFKLFEIKTNGYGGIVIHIDEIFKDKETRRLRRLFVNAPDYIFRIGFIIDNNNNNNIELFISFSGSMLTSINMTDIYNIDDFYALKIELNTNNMINVYVNDILYIEYNMDLIDLPLNYKINYFGMQNNELSVHSKYVYMAGIESPFIYMNDSNLINTTNAMKFINSTINTGSIYVGNDNPSTSTTNVLKTDNMDTTLINSDNNNEGSNNKDELVIFAMSDLILLFVVVIGAVCIILCALFCCLLYIKKILKNATKSTATKQSKDDINNISNIPNPCHIPQYSSIDISLGDNVLQRKETLELPEIPKTPENIELNNNNNNNNNNDDNNNNKNNIFKRERRLEMESNINENFLSPKMGELDIKGSMSNSNALYDEYVTKGAEVFKIPNINYDIYRGSMNEGCDRKQIKMDKYKQQQQQDDDSIITSDISDLFGSQYKKENHHIFSVNNDHQTLHDMNEDNSTSSDDNHQYNENKKLQCNNNKNKNNKNNNNNNNDINIIEMDGNPTTLSVYV